MYKLLIMFSSIVFLQACTGVNPQDSRQLANLVSLNNHILVKRQRQFVISPASSIGLLIKGSPDKHKHISERFKHYFRHAELAGSSDSLANKYDFVFKIALLKMEMKNQANNTRAGENKKAIMAKKLEANQPDVQPLEPVKNRKSKKSAKLLGPIKIKPLEVAMSISLVDAVSGQPLDIAFIDAYSSSIRQPKESDFIKSVINRYIEALTSI